MKTYSVIYPALMFGFSALAHAQAAAAPKPATIQVQQAIISTKEGQKAAQELQAKFTPKRQALEKKQSDIAAMQSQMRAGSATMSQAAKDKLARDITSGQQTLQRDNEDFEADVQQEQGKVMGSLGEKMMAVINKYATEKGISVLIDTSNPQSPVLWSDPAIDITAEVIKLYDQANPGTEAAKPSAPSTTPAPPATKK